MKNTIRKWLKDEFENWSSENAIFGRLLETLEEVPDNLWDAYAAALERDTNANIKAGGSFVETDYLRSIARGAQFAPEPESAAAYIRGYIEEVSFDRPLRREAYA